MYRVVAAFAVLAALGACSSDSTSPGASGGVSFSYAGSEVGTGSFSASGTMPTSTAQLNNQDAAAAEHDASQDMFNVAAVNARGGSQYDIAFLSTGRLTVGSTSVDQNCDPTTTACANFAYLTNANFTNQTYDELCGLLSGTISITEVTASRVKGTFTGSGFCVASQTQNVSTFSTTSGTFDVTIISSLPDTGF